MRKEKYDQKLNELEESPSAWDYYLFKWRSEALVEGAWLRDFSLIGRGILWPKQGTGR
jgi:hypothetical protein